FSHNYKAADPRIDTHWKFLHFLREVFRAPLETLPLGAGVFATNDEVGVLILQVMKQFYPEHLMASGVLGVDNAAGYDQYLGGLPGLSSIVPAFHQLGAAAIDWLLDHPGPEGKERVASLSKRFAPVKVITRESTAAGACEDPVTSQIIRWAWVRIQRGESVQVNDMAKAHRQGRQTLDRKFTEHVGTTPVELLARMRLDLARELLRDSHLSIAEISARCGFSKQDVLSRAMRRAYGYTPRDYRQQHSLKSSDGGF
ncbi:MAG: helix-turn-helix domain-containing protein, partial [Kiritimatiellae bacterium]|nr:helix-turn-helix domain-containing protein [Kiritimatiellia bacterium]